MTELIFRLLSPKKRESYANLWFQQNPECYDDFMSIRDAEFESVRISTLFIITHSNSGEKGRMRNIVAETLFPEPGNIFARNSVYARPYRIRRSACLSRNVCFSCCKLGEIRRRMEAKLCYSKSRLSHLICIELPQQLRKNDSCYWYIQSSFSPWS